MSDLQLAEANALALGVVQRAAVRQGLCTLVIKGASLRLHGLRKGYQPGDVDVLLIDGTAARHLVEALRGDGWRVRPDTFGSDRMTTHSVSLMHDGWPNDIDVHSEYPGISRRAFDTMWERRVQVELGGVHCWIPDRFSSIVLWALHSLRGTERQPRHKKEWEHLVNGILPSLSETERSALADTAVALGAGQVLSGVPGFSELLSGVELPMDEAVAKAWQRKVAQAHEFTPWFQVLRDAKPLERPRVIWNAVWPSAHDLRLLVADLDDTLIGRTRARLRRIGNFLTRAITGLRRRSSKV